MIRNHKLPNIYIYIYIYMNSPLREREGGRGKTKHKTCRGDDRKKALKSKSNRANFNQCASTHSLFGIEAAQVSKMMASWVQFFTFHYVGFFLVDEEGE